MLQLFETSALLFLSYGKMAFYGCLFSPHIPLGKKGELLSISPLVLGVEIFMLLVHLSPLDKPMSWCEQPPHMLLLLG